MEEEVLHRIVERLIDAEVTAARILGGDAEALAAGWALILKTAINATDADRIRVLQAVALEIVEGE